MAVRTNQAGIRNKRKVGVRSAMPSTGATRGKKTLPRDEAAALRREKSLSKMQLGPAAKETEYSRGRAETTLRGRKKAPSQMNVKRKGGPFKKTRLHGG
jgi:hypothetical protein